MAIMSKYILATALVASAITVSASNTMERYTDSLTGISFGRHTDSDTGFSFGLAMPTTMGSDFIGQMTVPVSSGYGAVALGGSMTNNILIVAQPSGSSVVSSLRTATGYTNPQVLSTNSSFRLQPIESGIAVNSSAFTYTFLCKGCITGDTQSWSTSATEAVIGWAMSTTALTDPSSASGTLNYHDAGFGLFGAPFDNTTSSDYSTWAALASAADSGSNSSLPSSGNSTTPTNGAANLTTTTSNETYDYIVAGGGVAGLIVSERLAESGKSVLLIERGQASTASTGGSAYVSWNNSVTQYDVPAMAYYLTTASETSEYCTDTASMAGCILGGSGMVNAMMWVKPQSADFEKWPKGWQWGDVEGSAAALYNRTPGTVQASKDGEKYDQGAYNLMSSFLAGNGFSEVDALEDVEAKKDVYSHPPWLIKDGLRGGPIRDYLPLAQQMNNFKMSLNTKVIRAIRSNSTVTGVEVETGTNQRQIINLNSDGAVVFTAGALSTPRLLFNSGIGPKEQIQTVKNGSVSVTLPAESEWIDLPVGEGIMDHPIFTIKLTTKSTLQSLSSIAFTSPNVTNIDLFAQQSGLLAQSGQRLNFWTSVTNKDNSTRYIQGTVNSPANNTIQIKVYLTHGLTSSGSLVIAADGATEFGTQPYLTTSGDKEAILSFMNRLISWTKQSNSTLSFPSSNVTAESLIANYVTGSHYVASAAMGETKDGNSVVDSETRVWGTDNLFVADASIHPDLPTGNTQAIVMVVAEKAAGVILKADKSGSGSGAGNVTVTTKPAATSTPVATPTFTGWQNSTFSAPTATPTKGKSSCRARRMKARRKASGLY